ncbi:hypothetical protein [Paenibacillus sp. CF384]|uniref:hypothetical protein n=1 Tax=Paenibacillus sp. CF384 TaxID=1884382 RepID=UPI00089B3FC0|nr:hypothetical protein [Paenibacillus sp. CF384]SDX37615.1 hypothetical protein SAMN05518855_10135 [Paenibacillus sp. CF384]
MKRYFVIAIAAAALMTAGCNNTPGAGRSLMGEQNDNGKAVSQEAALLDAQETEATAAESETTEVEAPANDADTEEAVAADPPAAAAEDTAANQSSEAASESTKPEAKPAEEKPAPPKKTTKTEQKVKEATKSNLDANKAVTDSIMDNAADQKTADKQVSEAFKSSIELIRSQIKDLKQHAENNDAEQIKTVSDQIITSWDAMKADVKAAASDMVKFLDEKVVKLTELNGTETIDQTAILQIDYELYQGFRQLADKAGVK